MEGRTMDSKEGNVTASVEMIAYQNMLLTEAIFEILAEKNILTGVEVIERIKKLKAETKLKFSRVQ
jgi:hypothetical protein